MGSADQVDVLFLQERGNYITAEDETNSSFVFSPSWHALLWVSPEQITEKSLIGHLERSNQFQDLFEILELRTDASMHTQDLFINQGTDRHNIEDIGESFPEFDIVLSFT